MGVIFMGLEPLDAFPDASKGVRFGGGAVRELTNGPGFAIPILPEWGLIAMALPLVIVTARVLERRQPAPA